MLKVIRKLAVVGLATVAAGVSLATPVEAGTTPTLFVHFSVRAADALAVLDGVSVEVYEPGTPPTPADPAPTCTEGVPSGAGTSAQRDDMCGNLAPGAYVLGLTGVPENMPLTVECFESQVPNVVTQEVLVESDTVHPNFDTSNGPVDCFVALGSSLVVVDKDVFGGPADPPDFTHQVVQGQAVIGTGIDPAVDVYCDAGLADCAVINVAADSGVDAEVIALTETPPPGYVVDDVQCVEYYRIDDAGLDGTGIPDADLPSANDGTDIDLDLDGPSDAYCVVRNVWTGGTLDVDVSVINDNGGIGAPADVTIEIYDSTDALVSTHPCPADGNCVVDGMLPAGDYTIGYSGLPTYTDSWTQTVTPPLIPTGVDSQAIVTDDPDAEFTIVAGGLVEIDGVLDDPVPATTTTTTTTTVVPTTTTTTTIAVPLAPTIPATGTSGEANARMATLAIALIAAGGLLVVGVSRRRS
jgi:hypothetical protein